MREQASINNIIDGKDETEFALITFGIIIKYIFRYKLMNISSMEIKNVDALISKRTQLTGNAGPIGLADTAIYYYCKDASFFGKKQQRIVMIFFQGLNTNPQNLSIFLRDQVTRANKQSKQKLIKGQFIVYDMFTKNDCVIEISIPGNFQIYKIHKLKKQLISNIQIDMMYVSSILRSMYGKNIVWGKSYNLFGSKNILNQYKTFLSVFFRIVQKNDIFISDDYEQRSSVKGSHACSILYEYIKQKSIIHHSIQFIEKQVAARDGYGSAYPKMLILLAELYSCDGKYAKSLTIIGQLINRYDNDPLLLYYQAKYMLDLMAAHQALLIINSIIQYNQFQTWCLAAELHIQLKNYSQALVCMNHASKIAGKAAKNAPKPIDSLYYQFDSLGKKIPLTNQDQIIQRPKLMLVSDNPLAISQNIQQKYLSIIQNQYWKMGYGQKIIYNILKQLRYRLESKKFQQLVTNTFEQPNKQYVVVNFKQGMSQSMFVQAQKEEMTARQKQNTIRQQQQELPHFLQDQSIQIEAEEIAKTNRNLSIIPQLESVIQNSQFQQKQKESHKITLIKIKKQLNQQFYKIIKALISQGDIQKAEFQQNWAKVLPVFNKLRTSSKFNSYYLQRMFEIMMKNQNYKSVIVLIAETLDLYQNLHIKKIQVLPFWMQRYIFQIIEQKGLKFLNGLLQKMSFFDEAIIDTIELAKNWKIKGCTF